MINVGADPSQPPRYRMSIRVDIQDAWQGGRLGFEEQLNIEAGSFLEIAHILGQVHELSEAIKRERGVEDG